jgi:LysR family transcriptional regulator, hca operon transcriptional activator
MEIRHLRYFCVLAEQLHFTKAALLLNIAQPALSHQIKQLEEELGTQLVERTNRRVRLTAAGEVFRDRATRSYTSRTI